MKKQKILVIALLSTITLISLGFTILHFVLAIKLTEMLYIDGVEAKVSNVVWEIIYLVPNFISLCICVFLLIFVPKNLGDYKTNKENREKDRAEKELKRIEAQRERTQRKREKLQKQLDELPRD